ncbi:MAG: hypothetical protein V1809_08965 [Planctomycetota bacterium]
MTWFLAHMLKIALAVSMTLIDASAILILVHLLARHWPARPLVALDAIGRPVVDELTRLTDALGVVLTGHPFQWKSRFVVCIVLLTVVRYMLEWVYRSI